MSHVAIIIEWPDGTVDKAPTPDAILSLIASDQWHDYEPEQMRWVLSDRVWNVRRAAIDPELPLLDFFLAMQKAGACSIIQWKPESEEEV